MAKKIFNFRNKFGISVEASDSLLSRIGANIQEETQGPIRLKEAEIIIHEPAVYERIIRDKRFPYSRVETDSSTNTLSYYRYNTLVRTIKVLTKGLYEVRANTWGDESAGLICFRHFCNNHLTLSQTPLVHASLVSLGNEGVLIAGDTRAGKTSLMIYLMQYLGAGLISEDNVYLERDMTGFYFPKVPRVRFATVRDSCLSPLLNNLKATEATQYWDVESIEKVVASGDLEVDGGLAISRRKLAEMCGVQTRGSIKIGTIIFPLYWENHPVLSEPPCAKSTGHQLNDAN